MAASGRFPMTDEKPKPQPRGVIAIMTSPDGDVIATFADFDRQAPGGCKLWEGQKWRARTQVKWAAVRAYCSQTVSDALSSYLCERIADALCEKGHKITYRAIGYPEDVAREVERS
jgi:hypothetical protein